MKKPLLVNVVDDDPNIRILLTKILQKEGYEVVAYSSATEAIEKINTSFPQIIVSDIMMPGMNGIQFCSKIKSQKNYIYFILLTAKSSVEDKIIGIDTGADEYIPKPFDKFEVVARINAGKRIVDFYIKTLKYIDKIEHLKSNINSIKEIINSTCDNNLNLIQAVNEMETELKELENNLKQSDPENYSCQRQL